jgi:ketosteroid isomerase-like protein
MSSAEKNKALVRRFLEAHANGDLEALEEMLAPDFVNHNLLPGQAPGLEGYLRSFTEYGRRRRGDDNLHRKLYP